MSHKNNEILTAIHNLKYTLAAQFIVLILGIIKTLLIPKLISVPDFGYWQIYALYSTFVGIFALGFNEGVYLLYGKYQYNELPFEKLRTATRLFCVLLFTLTICGIALSTLLEDQARTYAFAFVSLDIFIVGLYKLFIYVLQITNQMKAYSKYFIIDKLIFLCAILLIAFLPQKSFQQIIVADVISKLIATVALIWKSKEILIGEGVSLQHGFQEFSQNIKVGISLMIANLLGMFIMALGRFVVDIFGNISEYAYYSLGTSITNLVLVVISSVSLLLYPTLKRLDEKNYQRYFLQIDFSVALFSFISLLGYFPAYLIVLKILPNYYDMLAYLNILFAIIILQAKMQLLNNTFYNALREERALLKANIGCIVFFCIAVSILYGLTREVWSVALATFLAMLYRCYVSEVFLLKKLDHPFPKRSIVEIGYLLGFIVLTSFSNLVVGSVLYLLAFCIYGYIYRHSIVNLIRSGKNIM